MTIWQAPTPGQATLVGHANQNLTSHASTFTYNGAVINSDPTLAGSNFPLGNQILAQQFVLSSPVTLGSVLLALGAVNAGQDVLVTVQADSAGSPSGTPLVGCVVPPEWMPASTAPKSLYTVPLPITLAAGTYYIVAQPGSNLIGLAGNYLQVATGENDVTWTKTTASSGAQSFSSGSWHTQTFGLGVYLRDNTGTVLQAISDDQVPGVSYPLPAKVTSYAYSGGLLTSAFEWVVRGLNITPTLLCRDDASFEFSVGTVGPGTINCSFGQSTAHALDGKGSLLLVATANGDVTARIGPYAITAGNTYSWIASFLSGGANEAAHADVLWYNGASLLSTSPGEVVTITSPAWTPSDGSAIAPATATLAYMNFIIESAPASSQYFIDGVGLFPGSTAVWAYPGVGIATARTLNYTSGELVSIV